ncbi:MAG: dolichyl-phosphate beta-glucosyltransferase [Nanoarchaeota archaeon]|nr:glycosyltransferase family 2 protein [Nanoarchaeota archaeon]
MLISIIIPAYNEEDRIIKTLEQIADYINKRKKYNFEIIIVDDGSTDRTLEIVEKFKELKIKLLQNKKNMGKGFSVKKGILESKGEFALFMDADSSTSINELDKFLSCKEKQDILIGSRHLKENSILVKQSIIRRIAGFFAHKLIHFIIVSDIKDTMCGFKMFDKKSKILFKKQLNYRWGFDYELLYLAEKLGFKIKEIPVIWKDDKKSKVTLAGYLTALIELFKIRLNDFLGKYN